MRRRPHPIRKRRRGGLGGFFVCGGGELSALRPSLNLCLCPKSLNIISLSNMRAYRIFCIWGSRATLRAETRAADYRNRSRHRARRFRGEASCHQGCSLMPKPSECIDREDSSSWLHFVLEIGEDHAIGRPLAQGILNHLEPRWGVSTLTEPVASERSGHNIRRL